MPRSIARYKFLDETTAPEPLDQLSACEAFGCAAEPWEVAATIAFLAGEYSNYLTWRGDFGIKPAPMSVSSQYPTRAMIREDG